MDNKSEFSISISTSWSAWLAMLSDLREDIDRYVFIDRKHWLQMFLTKPGLYVSTQYRISRWVHFYCHVPLLRPMLKLVCAIWQKIVEIFIGVELPNRAEIGAGLFIPHANGIIVNTDVKIGRYCNLSHQVTIGVGGRGANQGTPSLGDRVFVGPGAKIFGPIEIGHDVAIGANAVVLKNTPNNAVVAGVPAKIISYNGSRDFIVYRGRDDDQLAGMLSQTSHPELQIK
jgi:serine O-acetyltransferase